MKKNIVIVIILFVIMMTSCDTKQQNIDDLYMNSFERTNPPIDIVINYYIHEIDGLKNSDANLIIVRIDGFFFGELDEMYAALNGEHDFGTNIQITVIDPINGAIPGEKTMIIYENFSGSPLNVSDLFEIGDYLLVSPYQHYTGFFGMTNGLYMILPHTFNESVEIDNQNDVIRNILLPYYEAFDLD